jgi:shikimate kinase
MKEIKNTIFYLIGFPATGKYTIAKELTKIDKVRLVDNHLINNPIFSLLTPFKKLPDGVWDNILKIYDIVHDTIINHARKDDSFVCTNVLFEGEPLDVDLFSRVKNVANKRNARFIPVRLTCDLKELEKRIVNNDRKERFKLTDPKIAKAICEKKILFIPKENNTINIDVTNKTPKEVVQEILKKMV